MHAEIEAVVFDFGNVLTLAPLEHHTAELQRLCEMDRPTFDLEYRRQRPDYDRGTIDGGEYWSRIMRSGGDVPTTEKIRALIEEDTAGWTRINEPVVAWARSLQREGVRTGILSNMPRDILERIVDRFEWIVAFEAKIFSCDLGVIKPESGIYRACLDTLGLEGSKVLFLDDCPENVEGAKRSEFNTILFRNHSDALQHIRRKNWLPRRLTAAQQEDA
jgi:putative hydrolase of the HAD superfamily